MNKIKNWKTFSIFNSFFFSFCSWNFPDFLLKSSLGRYDGNYVEDMYQRTQGKGLNQPGALKQAYQELKFFLQPKSKLWNSNQTSYLTKMTQKIFILFLHTLFFIVLSSRTFKNSICSKFWNSTFKISNGIYFFHFYTNLIYDIKISLNMWNFQLLIHDYFPKSFPKKKKRVLF